MLYKVAILNLNSSIIRYKRSPILRFESNSCRTSTYMVGYKQTLNTWKVYWSKWRRYWSTNWIYSFAIVIFVKKATLENGLHLGKKIGFESKKCVRSSWNGKLLSKKLPWWTSNFKWKVDANHLTVQHMNWYWKS